MTDNRMEPEITVIVTVYNKEKYIQRCLQSLWDQTFPKEQFHVLLVDDGSTDRSVAVMEDFIASCGSTASSLFELVRQENRGPGGARNTGLSLAKGKYVIFFDGDDAYAANTLETLFAKAEKDQLDLLLFDAVAYDEEGRETRNQKYDRRDFPGTVMTGKMAMARLVERKQMTTSTVLFLARRDLYEKNHLRFEEHMIHEDDLFTMQVFYHAQKVLYSGDRLYLRYFNPGSIVTAANPLSEFTALSRVFQTYVHFYATWDLGDDEPGSQGYVRKMFLKFTRSKFCTMYYNYWILMDSRFARFAGQPCREKGSGKKAQCRRTEQENEALIRSGLGQNPAVYRTRAKLLILAKTALHRQV